MAKTLLALLLLPLFTMVLAEELETLPTTSPAPSPHHPPSHPPHHHHHHHHPPSIAPSLPPHHHYPPSTVPVHPPTHHHYPPVPAKPPVHPPVPGVKSPVHPPVPGVKPPVHPPVPGVKPPVHAPVPAKSPVHPPVPSVKPPVHAPVPGVKPPVHPPVHAPVPGVKPPMFHFPRSFIAVQGVVYVKSCQYAGLDTLLGAAPLLDAVVKLQCNNTRYKVVRTAKTDKNGYFYVEAPKSVTTFGVHKCNVVLVSAPRGLKPSNLHGGVTGSTLRPEKAFVSNKLPFVLYTAGPLAFEPKCHH